MMRTKKTTKKVEGGNGLTRAEPASLSGAQRKLVAEALRRAAETHEAVEGALVSYGRWLLVQVFDDDTRAALEERRDNPVWLDLLARAGGPTLRLGRKSLYVALHVAAYDKRITDEAWRTLDIGRKEILLPLRDEGALREAAQHVTSMKLTQQATRAYVASLLAERGDGGLRRLTAPRIVAHVRGFRERVTDGAYRRRALAVLRDVDDAEVEAVRREVEAVRAWAEVFLAKLGER